MDINKLPRPLKRYAARIEDVSDERSSGDGYWVYLTPGWIWEHDTHQIHEDSPTACARQFAGVARCECDSCAQGHN